MACKHPLKGFPIGRTETGKVKYLVRPYETEFVLDSNRQPVTDYTLIPCGQCIECRLEYSRQWANRCLLELQYHDEAHFVTLTYNNEHLPSSYCVDDHTGEIVHEHHTLRKRDFQLFMKRLRKAFPDDKIRFFACGEYGSNTMRPHYHAILFGLHLDDLVYHGRSELGDPYFLSQSLQDCWSLYGKPIGHVLVAGVSWETCAYVARYVTKKLKGKDAKFYKQNNIEPEFTLMSRKPGIGAQYYLDHPDAMDFDFINVATEKGGKKFRPPKYFDRLLEKENPELLEQMKSLRKKCGEDAMALKMFNTDLSELDYLAVEENVLASRIKSLKRRIE